MSPREIRVESVSADFLRGNDREKDGNDTAPLEGMNTSEEYGPLRLVVEDDPTNDLIVPA